MKLDTDTRLFDSSASLETNAFSIAASSKAFQILSDQLYTDKPRAILRELSTNALDAHIAAGKEDEPFEVQLPTIFDTTLIVKDNGVGMTPEQIKHLYTTYFGSDKTHTNDLVGGLGLGSKSPFAYTDQFTAISRHSGTRYTYAAFINEAGIPEISLISTEETEDCNGFEVHVPVKKSDVYTFEQTARRVFRYFQTRPSININLHLEDDDEPVLEMHSGDIKAFLYANQRETMIMQGPIAYPVDTRALRDALDTSAGTSHSDRTRMMSFFQTGWRIHAPIGTFEITASRESLSYTKKTIESLFTLATDIRRQVQAKALTELKNATDVQTANQLLTAANSQIAGNAFQGLEWRGLKWAANGFNVPLLDGLEARQVTKKHWGHFKDKKNSVETRVSTLDMNITNSKINLYWSAKVRPYKQFIDDNNLYPGKNEMLLYITGPKDVFDTWRKRLGLNTFTEVPKVTKAQAKQNPNKGVHLGATEYEVNMFDGNFRYSNKFTADIIRDEGAPVLIVNSRSEKSVQASRLDTLLKSGVMSYKYPMYIVYIPPTHTRVRKALLKEPLITDDQNIFIRNHAKSADVITTEYLNACVADTVYQKFIVPTIGSYERILAGATLSNKKAQAFIDKLDAIRAIAGERDASKNALRILKSAGMSLPGPYDAEVPFAPHAEIVERATDLELQLKTEGAPYINALSTAWEAISSAHIYTQFKGSPIQKLFIEWIEAHFVTPTTQQEAA